MTLQKNGVTQRMDPLEQLITALREHGVYFNENEPLKKHTSFKIGGPAAILCEPQRVEELTDALQAAKAAGVRVYILGNGTNVLFRDEGFAGMVVKMRGEFEDVLVDGDEITTGCGALLSRVCIAAKNAALTGLEFAYGIPGGVGGAVYMNAGAYGGEMVDVLQSVDCLCEDGKIYTLQAGELALGYRKSVFQTNRCVILNAKYKLRPGNAAEIEAKMNANLTSRNEKQPVEMPSAGSAFKRPQGAFAAALIDQSGLRGYRVGGAAISEKHCGFIVNLGGATCADVLQLADEVAKIVEVKTGYKLEKEIRVV